MVKKKQIVVIVSVVVLMGLLLSLNIKGLVKDDEAGVAAGEASSAAQTSSAIVTLQTVSDAAKQSLAVNLAEDITRLEEEVKQTSGAEKVKLQKTLAQKWDDVNQPAPGAFYYMEVSKAEGGFKNWLKTGDLFTEAYQNSTDSLAQPVFIHNATDAYKKAVELDPKNLDAKAGLGIAYVNGSANPMEGIQLLLEVVKQEPKHIKANMNLGLFSIKSGQFDKAVDRFKTVTQAEPNPEAWFYLASCYETLGMKGDAIAAYEKSKELAADPGLSQYVDRKVEELRK
ncbi:MAG TPA: tetratricopeptide repeat protein [Sphingobacteriaceae bacterium]